MTVERCLGVIALLLSIGGCAALPKGETRYYFPKAETQIRVTQTLSCNAQGKNLQQVLTVTPATAYSSDVGAELGIIRTKDFTGYLADSDLAITLTDDGRLSAINSAAIGQGGEVVKQIVSVATAAAVTVAALNQETDAAAACAKIAEYAGKAKDSGIGKKDDASPSAVTITYNVVFTYRKLSATELKIYRAQTSPGEPEEPGPLALFPDASSLGLYTALKKAIPNLGFFAEISPDYKVKVLNSGKWALPAGKTWDDVPSIELNSVAIADLQVRGLLPNEAGDLNDMGPVWKGQTYVPLSAKVDRIQIPVLAVPIFGTAKFSMSLSDYGSINKLNYSTTGTSDAAVALGSVGGLIAGALKRPTDAERASEIQAQADLIYQQQRLAACQADPTSCKSE